MKQSHSSEEFRGLIRLALPLMAAFVGHKLLGTVDMLVVGRLTTEDIAGVSLAKNLYAFMNIAGAGFLLGLDPLVAQALGRKAPAEAKNYLHQAFLLCCMLFPLIFCISLASFNVFDLVGVEKSVQAKAWLYFLPRCFSLLPYFLLISSRSFLQAHKQTSPIVWSAIIANIVNVPLSVILTFGDRFFESTLGFQLGFQGLGVYGAGLASAIVTVVQCVWLLYHLRSHEVKFKPSLFEAPLMKQLLNKGIPVGIHMMAEVGIFVTVSIIMGKFAPEIIAGHQIALEVASMTFIASNGLANAASVRVGIAVGEENIPKARTAGVTAIITGMVFMGTSAILLLLFRYPIASLFAKPAIVQAQAAKFFLIAAMFQVFDGMQVVASGCLRGAGITKPSMVMNILGHWLIGLPIGCFLAFATDVGPLGLWLGWTVGLGIVGPTLSWLVHKLPQTLSKELSPNI